MPVQVHTYTFCTRKINYFDFDFDYHLNKSLQGFVQRRLDKFEMR